jgi:hypothetical protein
MKQHGDGVQFQEKEVDDESLLSAESLEAETFKVVPPPAEKYCGTKAYFTHLSPVNVRKSKRGCQSFLCSW